MPRYMLTNFVGTKFTFDAEDDENAKEIVFNHFRDGSPKTLVREEDADTPDVLVKRYFAA